MLTCDIFLPATDEKKNCDDQSMLITAPSIKSSCNEQKGKKIIWRWESIRESNEGKFCNKSAIDTLKATYKNLCV